jgi:hypothetical protein
MTTTTPAGSIGGSGMMNSLTARLSTFAHESRLKDLQIAELSEQLEQTRVARAAVQQQTNACETALRRHQRDVLTMAIASATAEERALHLTTNERRLRTMVAQMRAIQHLRRQLNVTQRQSEPSSTYADPNRSATLFRADVVWSVQTWAGRRGHAIVSELNASMCAARCRLARLMNDASNQTASASDGLKNVVDWLIERAVASANMPSVTSSSTATESSSPLTRIAADLSSYLTHLEFLTSTAVNLDQL